VVGTAIFVKNMKEATKILGQDKRSSVQDLKPGTPTQTTKQWALVNTKINNREFLDHLKD